MVLLPLKGILPTRKNITSDRLIYNHRQKILKIKLFKVVFDVFIIMQKYLFVYVVFFENNYLPGRGYPHVYEIEWIIIVDNYKE